LVIKNLAIHDKCSCSGGQSCIDEVDVQQQGTVTLGDRIQVIVPMTAFSCNGRITGYLISLDYDSSESDNPTIQVFHRSIFSYSEVHRYVLLEDDITNMGTYHLANVSFTGDERVEFQSEYIIGYHIPDAPRNNIWNIKTMGYTSYFTNSAQPGNSVSDFGRNNVDNRQPLIQVIFGKPL